jgi:electron transport complex protein RnfG
MNEEGMNEDVQIEESTTSGSQETPAQEEVSTFRLVATLAVAGTLAGLLIVLVNQHTKPIIDIYKAEQLQKAVYEVLPGVERYNTYYLVDNALSFTLPEGAKESEYKRIYVGYDTGSQILGVAISRGESGFQDVFKDQAFVDQFYAGPETPLVGVKAGAGKGRPNEIDTITGATISSKVVIDIINHGMEEWMPVLDRGIPQAPTGSVDEEAKQ